MSRVPVSSQQYLPNLCCDSGHSPETRLIGLADAFEPIRLRDMNEVALLNRIDTKFVFSMEQLFSVLSDLRSHYWILSINQHKIHGYRTLYFDTPDFELYYEHVTGRADIYKVRSREYLDTHLAYLEVKHKTPKRRTEKFRLQVANPGERLDEPMQQYLLGSLPVPAQDLQPWLWNTFRRMTLVSKTSLERVTIDLNLSFFHERQALSLDRVVVAEVKQDRFSMQSPFIAEMRRQGIRRMGFSKYCFGVAQLYQGIKKNAQKEKVLMIQKIQHGDLDYVRHA